MRKVREIAHQFSWVEERLKRAVKLCINVRYAHPNCRLRRVVLVFFSLFLLHEILSGDVVDKMIDRWRYLKQNKKKTFNNKYFATRKLLKLNWIITIWLWFCVSSWRFGEPLNPDYFTNFKNKKTCWNWSTERTSIFTFFRSFFRNQKMN